MESSIETILADLVAMRTVTADTKANDKALDYIEQYLRDRSLSCTRLRFADSGVLVATTRGQRKQPTVLLYAHADVMVGSDDLFTLEKDNDKLLGRGTYDMKFAIAAYMVLIDMLKDKLDDYDFGILISTDEERSSRAMPLVTAAGYLPKVVVMPDGGGEWKVEHLAKGHWRFNVIARGRAAHGSRPWEGESASFKLLAALHDLHTRFKDHGPATDTLNIGMLRGGEAFNQIPSLMTAAVEIRLSTADSLAKQRAMIERLCIRHNVSYSTDAIAAPYVTDLKNPYVRSFMRSIEAELGTQPGTCISYGGSDAVYFDKYHVPCVLVRPVGGGHHSEDEWISRASLKHFVPILRDYLERAAKTPPATLSSVDKTSVVV